ncbi:MAG: hypothetical protein GXP49_10935 [Deltaproteobacteria bacterium]|nr:hypothetical protein [Deltaproteobacteria bacterium]
MSEPGICPKCGAKRIEGRPDCPKCGLIFSKLPSNFDPLWGDLDSPGTRIARRLTEKMENDWGNDELHHNFVEHCTRIGRLDLGIRYYKSFERKHPGDGTAQKKIKQLEKLVNFMYMEKLKAKKMPALPPKLKKWLPYILILISVGATLWYTLTQLSSFSSKFTGV